MTSLVLMGPPGVGKGTQARIISQALGIPAISTGQIFRTNIHSRSELGILAQQYIDRGELVPDSVTNPMVEARLSSPDVKNGFLLDGYPRSVEQAHVLRDILPKYGLELDLVLDITAPSEVLIEHLQKRASEESRSDDRPEVFAHRLEEYHLRTEPIATYYADQDLLETVNGVGTIEEVSARIFAVLHKYGVSSDSIAV